LLAHTDPLKLKIMMNDVFSACKDWLKKKLNVTQLYKNALCKFQGKNNEITDMGDVGTMLTSVNNKVFGFVYPK
jgi:hypothetical protein